jgi:hypothetical protein
MPVSSLMEKSLQEVVIALCADFERRQQAIKEKALPARVLLEYKYLNLRIIEGAMEVAGINNARIFIDDIGARRGYAHSSIEGLSEVSYKRIKAEVKRNIAGKLALIK